MRIGISGVGALGARAARQLVDAGVDRIALAGSSDERLRGLVGALGASAAVVDDLRGVEVDGVVLAGPAGSQIDAARDALAAGRHVVATTDDVDEVRELLALDAEARERGVSIAVGAAFSPGLSCVLAAHGAARFDEVEEIHIARAGTGGPACARQHHRAFGGMALDWRDGGWRRRRSGSGRELCWFPDPVGARDCYRAEAADPVLLAAAFAGVDRITAKVAANRRDRLTGRLPMLRPPHDEGGPGAIRVEVRGRIGARRDVDVLGALDRPAVAASAVAATAMRFALAGRMRRAGAAGLAELVEPVPFLAALAELGVKAAAFEGTR